MLEADTLVVSAVLLFLAALVQGYFGFGFGMAAMAGLTFTAELLHAAGVVNLIGLVLSAWIGWQLREGILWPLVWRMMGPLVVGVIIGVTALSSLDGTLMVRVLGVAIVAISGWNWASPSLRSSESAALDRLAALVGGLLGGAFNAGGPPLIAHLFRHPEHPDRLRATLQALFLGISLTRLPVAAAQGLITTAIWIDFALALPITLAAVALGDRLARRTDPSRFRRWCWLGLGLMGVALIVTA